MMDISSALVWVIGIGGLDVFVAGLDIVYVQTHPNTIYSEEVLKTQRELFAECKEKVRAGGGIGTLFKTSLKYEFSFPTFRAVYRGIRERRIRDVF